MAEYCSKCYFRYGMKEDFDLPQIAYKLKRGYSQTFICEGCSIRGLYKDNEGLTYVYYLEEQNLTPIQESFEWKEAKPETMLDKINQLFHNSNN